MRIGKQNLQLGTNADGSADDRAQRGKEEGFQGFFFKISGTLPVALGIRGNELLVNICALKIDRHCDY